LFVVHSDVCGQITPSTIDDKNYFVTFIDEFTHYGVTYLLENKSGVFSVFKDYSAKSETHFNLKIENLYCDNGREYLSKEMKDYCVQKGISYHFTVPHTPELNGVAERMNRTIIERARAMIHSVELGKEFWGEAVLTAMKLINISPTKALKVDKTPFEMWHGRKPTLKYLKVFGSTVYVHNKTRKSKFDEKSWKGILVGYEPNGYKVWDIEKGRFATVRDVIVDEVNYLKTRPVLKGNFENNSSKTDAFQGLPKSVITKSNSDNEISDLSKRSKSDESEKSDILKPSVIEISNLENQQTVVELEKQNETVTESNSKETEKTKELRRSDRISRRPAISYDESNIHNDYLLCAQSLVCKIPTSFEEIKQERIESNGSKPLKMK
jgi:Integrase core domain.